MSGKVRTVCIGFGYRGRYLMELLKQIPSFELVACADPFLTAEDISGLACYNDGPEDYLRMLQETKPRLAVIATPWDCHVPQACECLKHGCNVALEVRGCTASGEYDPLLSLEKSTGLKVFPLENTLFSKSLLAVRNMVSQGVLGRIMYMRGAYRHDIRDVLLDSGGQLGTGTGEGAWRGRTYLHSNGDLYPTHGFAPLCMIAGIGEKDSITEVSSSVSASAGLAEEIRDRGGKPLPVVMGDVVSTNIRTSSGILVSLLHDTTLPRPRGFDFQVQGTRGIWDGEGERIYVKGISPCEEWEKDEFWIECFKDQYWKEWEVEALAADPHHWGMDYVMLKSLEAALAGEIPYPAGLSDLAIWASITPLSCQSIKEGRTIKP